jgi:hypothetical protein
MAWKVQFFLSGMRKEENVWKTPEEEKNYPGASPSIIENSSQENLRPHIRLLGSEGDEYVVEIELWTGTIQPICVETHDKTLYVSIADSSVFYIVFPEAIPPKGIKIQSDQRKLTLRIPQPKTLRVYDNYRQPA